MQAANNLVAMIHQVKKEFLGIISDYPNFVEIRDRVTNEEEMREKNI